MGELLKKLAEKGLYQEPEGIIIKKYPNGDIQIAVDVESFAEIFKDTDYSYSQLVQTGESLNYKPTFDMWKDMGIL